MSQTEGKTLTRRSFLAATAVTAGAATVAGSGLAGLTPSAAYAAEEEKTVVQVCRAGCVTGCALCVHVRDGKVVKSEPADTPDPVYRNCCLRGLSYAQSVYSPDRLLHPVKRVARWKDEWEQISWDQAIDEIGAKLLQVRDTYGPKANALFSNGGNIGFMGGAMGGVPRFMNGLEMLSVDICVDYGFMPTLNRVFGATGSYGNTAEPKDLENANTFFVWGCNVTTAFADRWRHMNRAIAKGAKMVVIDPYFPPIASKADKYLRIRPASDAALALGMLNIGFRDKRFDYAFAKRATVAPFLVREDNGKFLRMSDLGVAPVEGPMDPMTGIAAMIDDPVVIDAATNEPMGLTACTDPLLTGTFEVAGVKVRCALDLLEERVAQFTPAWAAEQCAITVEDLEQVADMYYGGGTVAHLLGFGANQYDNASYFGHAFASLVCLTGNIGKPGTSATVNNNFALTFNALYMFPDFKNLTAVALCVLDLPEVVEKGSAVLPYGTFTAPKTLLITQCNPYTNFLNPQSWEAMRDKFEMVVVIDRIFNDTAHQLADYVLPACHYLEEDEFRPILSGSPYTVLAEKAVEPMGESLPDFEVLKRLATRVGMGQYFEGSFDDIVRANYLGDYDTLKREKIVRFQPEGVQPYSIDAGNLTTASGRFEFYSENPVTRQGVPVPPEQFSDNCLPTFKTPTVAWQDGSNKEYPYVLVQMRTRGLLHSQWYSVPWLREIHPEAAAYIHPEDAAEKGIADGDYIRAYNADGEAVLRAIYSTGTQRGALGCPTGWPFAGYKKGHLSYFTPVRHSNISMNHSYGEARVNIEKWEA